MGRYKILSIKKHKKHTSSFSALLPISKFSRQFCFLLFHVASLIGIEFDVGIELNMEKELFDFENEFNTENELITNL